MIRWQLRAWILACAFVSAFAAFAETIAEPPNVPGYLMIHGSRDVPQALAEALIAISGGPTAKLVYLTTAEGDDAATNLRFWVWNAISKNQKF